MNKRKIGIALLILTLFSACGNEDIQGEKEESKQETSSFLDVNQGDEGQNDKADRVRENGSIIFTTEYEIENYCNGLFIVSKSEGLLYGVLDLNGEEILPVQYDKIYFMREGKIADGELDDVYIETLYEDQRAVYDAKGNKLFDEWANIISYEMEVTTDNPPFWVTGNAKTVENETMELKIYRKDGTYVSTIQLEECCQASIIWVNDDICMISKYAYDNNSDVFRLARNEICVRYTSGEVLKQWEEGSFCVSSGIEGENYYAYIINKNGKYDKIVINADGNFLIEKTGLNEDEVPSYKYDYDYDKIMDSLSKGPQYHLGENKDYTIYQTNNTWKYEDASGNPIYEQRYYSLKKMDEGYALSNEDNQVCIITKNGKKTVDYGYIELNDSNYLFQGDTTLERDDVFTDYNSVCIVRTSVDGNQVYYWESK